MSANRDRIYRHGTVVQSNPATNHTDNNRPVSAHRRHIRLHRVRQPHCGSGNPYPANRDRYISDRERSFLTDVNSPAASPRRKPLHLRLDRIGLRAQRADSRPRHQSQTARRHIREIPIPVQNRAAFRDDRNIATGAHLSQNHITRRAQTYRSGSARNPRPIRHHDRTRDRLQIQIANVRSRNLHPNSDKNRPPRVKARRPGSKRNRRINHQIRTGSPRAQKKIRLTRNRDTPIQNNASADRAKNQIPVAPSRRETRLQTGTHGSRPAIVPHAFHRNINPPNDHRIRFLHINPSRSRPGRQSRDGSPQVRRRLSDCTAREKPQPARRHVNIARTRSRNRSAQRGNRNIS